MPDFSPIKIVWRSDDGTEIPIELPDPFADQPSYANIFFTEIGLIILHWSRVEWQLDNLLHDIAHIEAATPYEGAPLKSFKRRVQSIKDAIKGVEITYTIEPSEFTTYVFSQAKIVSKKRHILAHHNFAKFECDEIPKVTFVNLEGELINYTIANLQAIRSEIKMLEVQIIQLRFFAHAKVWSESGKFLPPVHGNSDLPPHADQ